jgi:type II restriction/modification system DNA methylase subunit YeeA
LLRRDLGDAAIDEMFSAYRGRVPAEADLACYWIDKAAEHVAAGKAVRSGLVVTNSIRGGANRRTLDRAMVCGLRIFDAWGDEPWEQDGAAVRASLLCLARRGDPWVGETRLDGELAEAVFTDLSARRPGRAAIDLTRAARLPENVGIAFMGDTKGGAFDVPGARTREWLCAPLNPNGRPNSDVLRPWANGLDVTRRSRDMWIIDFGWTMTEAEAALYERPFEHAVRHIGPARLARQGRGYAKSWWRHERARPEMWAVLATADRYIATPTLAKHRLFVWLPRSVVPDHQLIAVGRDDDTTFGILHSRFHEVWALRLGTSLEDRPRYTPSTTFETFPFPEGLTSKAAARAGGEDDRAVRIAEAARELDWQRGNWLNPPNMVRRQPEVAPGYPDRLVPVDSEAAAILAKRTLTKLYNERPTWLTNAHRALDEAVAAAYGWPADISEDEVLGQLLRLNQERSAAQTGWK